MAVKNNNYFWIEFEQPNGVVSGLTNDYTDMYHSFDGATWETTPKTLSMGDNTLVYFRNDSKKISTLTTRLIINFNSNARVGGDISSITNMEEYCCFKLFYNNKYLTDASELKLPWTTLAKDCYCSMFAGCSNLTTAPELPATTLADYCYEQMFYECFSLTTAPELPATTLADYCYHIMFYSSKLTTAPELPATTLADGCYYQMFHYCTKLTTAPVLPATTLADNCYYGMFDYCISLTTAPELPATTLANDCYGSMFAGCTNLNYIKMLATDISADSCLYHWVQDVAPTGTFVKAAENTTIPEESIDGIPIGWTVYNEGDPNIPEPEIPKTDEELKQQYFWVDFEETGGTISGLTNSYTEMYHSFDGNTWETTPSTLSMGSNTLVYFRNDRKKISDFNKFLTIRFNSNARVGGDISSITDMANYCCYGLFWNNEYLTDASELILPWTTLANYCYWEMFLGCTSLVNAPKLPATTLADACYFTMFGGCTNLTTAPELPATTLVDNCYDSMFQECTSLVNAPKLPATTLVFGCYNEMFEGCISLVNAPALPATTLAEYCYKYMFQNCISLTTAPELPATTLVDDCCIKMFRNCTNLNYIKMLATDISAENCLSNWVENVAPTGTFVKHPDNTTIPIDSDDGIPVGWTVVNAEIPDTPEEDLKQQYFWVEFEETEGEIRGVKTTNDMYGLTNYYSELQYSFDGETWNSPMKYSSGPEYIPMGDNKIVYLKNDSGMLGGYSSDSVRTKITFTARAKVGGKLSSLAYMREMAFSSLFSTNKFLTDASELILDWDTLEESCYSSMFYGCTSLVNAPALPATTLANNCYFNMFYGCTSLVNAPALPATTLARDCYANMFEGCTNLTTAPTLPAEILEADSYYRMFRGCTSLNYIEMLATTTPTNGCLSKWVENVAPTGTFVKHPNNTNIPVDSRDGIPVGWTVVNAEIPDEPTDPDNPNPPVDPDPDEPLEPEDGTIVSKTITIDNSAQDVEISVEQTNIALWTDVVIEEGDAYASLGTYDFTDSKITLEVNQNRSQTTRNIVIHIYAIDVNDNIVEGVITVVQDAYDVPIVPPEEITTPDIILYKTRLDFPATGGSLSVQVDYRNATTINTPTCSQSWVSIRQSGGGGYYFEDDGSRVDQRMWVITMEETQFYRSAPIIFLCTNNVGTIFEEDKFMVYQTGPTSEDVEGDSYILVPKKEISLKEIGDSEEIIITYANVADIVAPEVPEGYEITEISRTQIDGNTIEVKYKITKIEESKDDAKVIFKAQGKGGSEVKSDTTIKGWTPPTEPATVELPEIDLDNGVLVFEHTGGTRTIRLTIDGYTKPMNVDVTINDTNNNIHLVKNESDYDDGYDYCVWKLVFESEGNTTNNPYEGTIDIHYTDGLTDKTISFPFYVRYEGEGLIKEFSNNFKFDKDGELLSMSDNIGVGYLNIMTYHIPTHPDWIIIGTPTDGGVSVSYDKVYRYPISVQPNEGAERTGIVRISGIGKDGKEYYTDVTVLQEGTNTEVIIDEGFIELQSLSVTLPAEGGSETFQVKYYDLQELLEPEFVGDWATIEKVSETSEDGVAWNGEECVVTTVTYKATAKATTYGRQAKVIFKSYINYGDGGRLYMEKDKFRVNQLAPNATGTMGTVFAFSNNITVDSRGFAAGDTIWKEARVGYKDVTIEYPVIDVDWFRIAKIVDKGSSKEYDALKYYELEFDKNLAAFSRTGTITFKGKNEDGTYTTAIVRVVQLGEEPVDPETGLAHNYKGYFKSLDCTLYSVSLITQPGYDSYEEIILAGDSPVVVSYTESDRLYEPLRTSTCTIKVVSSSYLMNLYTGKAQGTQVVVKNEDTGEIEWCGFLQPNLYNQGFSAPVETIEFEASDCLNTLQYIDYSDVYSNGRFVVTFKEIIDDIMDRCKLINSYYVTQKMYSDTFQSKTMDFNNFYISEYNFYSEEEEPWKLKEVLEEICKYMGYVCFQWGDSVYFMDYDMYKEKKMNGARWDKSTRWNTKNAVLISEKANEIVADSYMGTGASMSLDDVFNSVKVNCNYYNVDDLIPDLFEDDYLTNRHGENAVISISRYGGRGNSVLMNKTFYRVYDHKYINSLYYSPVTSTSLHETKVEPTEEQFKDRFFFRDFIGGNIVDMVHLNYSEANEKVGESKDLERYLLISQLNRPWCGAEGTFHWENYNFPIMEYKNIPVIFIDNTAEDETTRTATRATSSSRPNTRPQKKVPMPNYLVINASAAFVADLSGEYLSDTIEKGLGKKASQSWYTYGGSSIDEVRNAPALCFYLEIPQAGWWNGSTWVDYKTHFEVRLDRFTDGTDDNKKYYEHMFGIEKDVFNTVETYLFLGTTGYRIPLPKVMDTTRDMYFAIAMPKRFVHCSDSYGGDNTGKIGNAYCFIKDLEMKIVNRNTIFYENDEDEVYENVIDNAFVVEGEEIDLKITSDNYKRFSYSTVSTRTAEDVPTTDIQFYNKNMELRKPEEAIIERYVNQYSTPSIKTSLTLDMSFKPYELITDTYWKKDFVITGQEIDYKNASQTITLLEKK